MGTPMTPHLPTSADLDAVAADQAAADATKGQPHPQATPAAHPQVEDQTAQPGNAPDSLPNENSHRKPVQGGPTQPSLDTTEFDDMGNKKTDAGPHGPRGVNLPADVQTEEQRQAAADAKEKVMQAGLAPTNAIDSRGELKGRFAVTPQGHDEHGMRLPDKVDTSKVLEPVAAHVGPRGSGAPLDSFHGPRPVKK